MENAHVKKKHKTKVGRVFPYATGSDRVNVVLHTLNF